MLQVPEERASIDLASFNCPQADNGGRIWIVMQACRYHGECGLEHERELGFIVPGAWGPAFSHSDALNSMEKIPYTSIGISMDGSGTAAWESRDLGQYSWKMSDPCVQIEE